MLVDTGNTSIVLPDEPCEPLRRIIEGLAEKMQPMVALPRGFPHDQAVNGVHRDLHRD